MKETTNIHGTDEGNLTGVLPEEWVYFMYSAGLIKIGYTTNILKRLTEIKAMSGAPVELIAIVPGNRRFEKTLHRMFKSHRERGEWFRASADVRRFLSCLDDAVAATMPPEARLAAGSCVARLELAETAK